MHFGQIFSMGRVGPSRRQLIRANANCTCIVHYKSNSQKDCLGEACLIFELLGNRYCLIRKLVKTELVQLASFLTGRRKPTLRPVHKLLADTYCIVQRSDVCVVIEFNQVIQIEQIAWMGILGTKDPNQFGIHNNVVNTSLFSSAEQQR